MMEQAVPEVKVGFQVDVGDVARGYEPATVKVGDSVRLVGEPIDVGFPHKVLDVRIVPDIVGPQLLLTSKVGNKWVTGPFAELSAVPEVDITKGVIKKGDKLIADPENIPAARAFVAELRRLADEAEQQASASTESKARKLMQNARQARRDADNIEMTIPKPSAMSVVEYDRQYSLKELREKARQEGLSPSGSKKEIAAKLIARGVK